MANNPQYFTTVKSYKPFRGLYDPCPPIGLKTYVTPPNLYYRFQPPNFEQFSALDALKYGTLWKPLYDYYGSPAKEGRT